MPKSLIIAFASLIAGVLGQGGPPSWLLDFSARTRPPLLPPRLLWDEGHFRWCDKTYFSNTAWENHYSSGDLSLEIYGAVPRTPDNHLGALRTKYVTPFVSVLGLSEAYAQTLFPKGTPCLVICGLLPDGRSAVAVWISEGAPSIASSMLVMLPLSFPPDAVICRASLVGQSLYAFDVAEGRIMRFSDSDHDLLPDTLDTKFQYQNKADPIDEGIFEFHDFGASPRAEVIFQSRHGSPEFATGLVRIADGTIEMHGICRVADCEEWIATQVTLTESPVAGQDYLKFNSNESVSLVAEVADAIDGDYSTIGAVERSQSWPEEHTLPLSRRLRSGEFLRVKSSLGRRWTRPLCVLPSSHIAIKWQKKEPVDGGLRLRVFGVNFPTSGTIEFHGSHLPSGKTDRIPFTQSVNVLERSSRLLVLTMNTPGTQTTGTIFFVPPGGGPKTRLSGFFHL